MPPILSPAAWGAHLASDENPNGRPERQTPFARAFAQSFVSDRYGMATTHWHKPMDRVARGVGNPCPLLPIGLPLSAVADHSAASPDL